MNTAVLSIGIGVAFVVGFVAGVLWTWFWWDDSPWRYNENDSDDVGGN